MIFTEAEMTYLNDQPLGRLATLRADGTLQNNPVGFTYNPKLDTIDIVGHDLAASRKFRNIANNGQAGFVVDDLASRQPWRPRCLEIRGTGEALTSLAGGEPLIRIRPRRIISFGIDPADTGPGKRDVSTSSRD